MNSSILKTTTIFIALFLLVNLFCPELYAYTFFVKGETAYYYLIAGSDLFTYANRSNKQEIYKALSDGTLIAKNTAIMENFYSGLELPPVLEQGMTINRYYSSEKSDQYMNAVTLEMIKGADTIDEAVNKIGMWLRQYVRYSMGTSSEPASVYKTKRAFCEGYKNLVVELLSQTGLPAQGISCYVPPGHGWGSGSAGGYHAFAQYYYPGYGWVCLDPQATLNYADPYHLINAGAGNFKKDLKIVDNSYVTDYQEAPKTWNTFTACGKKDILHPVLIFKFIDENGTALHFPLFSYTSTLNELNITARSQGGFSTKIGLDVTRYAAGFSAVTSPYSPYSSFIYNSPALAEIKGRDTMSINSRSCLFITTYDFNGNGNYFFEADFQADKDAKKIFLFDQAGKTLAGKQVEIITGTGKYRMTSDADGILYLKIPDNTVQLKLDQTEYPLIFHEQKEMYWPAKPDFNKRIEAFLTKKEQPLNKAGLICVVYDQYGHISNNSSETMQIYTAKSKPLVIKKEDGLLFYNNLELNKDYFILVNTGNFYFKRKVNFTAGKIERFQFSRADKDRATGLTFENTQDDSLVFYEYYESFVFTYPAREGKVYLDFPPGLYLFADNNKKNRIIPVEITGQKKELVYAYNKLSFADFLTTRELTHNTKTGLAGTLNIAPHSICVSVLEQYMASLEQAADRDFLARIYKKSREWSSSYDLDEKATAAERRRITQLIPAGTTGTALTLLNLKTGKADKLITEAAGYFFLPAPGENTEYLLCYADNAENARSVFYVKHFRTTGKDFYRVDMEETGEPILLKAFSGKQPYYSKPPVCYLLNPRFTTNKVITDSLEIRMNNKGTITVFLDEGSCFFSLEKSINTARIIPADSPVREYSLIAEPNAEDYTERIAGIYKSFYPPDKSLLLILLKDKNGTVLGNKTVTLRTDKTEIKQTADKNGCIRAEGLNPDKTYKLRYTDKGVYVDYPLPEAGQGVNTVSLNLETLPCYTLTAKKAADQMLLCYPQVVKGNLVLDTVNLLFDKKHRLDFFLEPGTYFFKIGKHKILADYTFEKSARYIIDFEASRDALPAAQKLLTAFFTDKPAYLIRLTDNNTPLADYTAELVAGKRRTPYKVPKDGLFYTVNPGTDELIFEYKTNGFFIRKALPASDSPQTCILDRKKQASLLLSLTGKASKLKNRVLYLYTGGVLDDKKKLKYKEKLILKANDSGQLYLTIPDGKYYLEVNANIYEAVDVQAGKLKKHTIKISS